MNQGGEIIDLFDKGFEIIDQIRDDLLVQPPGKGRMAQADEMSFLRNYRPVQGIGDDCPRPAR